MAESTVMSWTCRTCCPSAPRADRQHRTSIGRSSPRWPRSSTACIPMFWRCRRWAATTCSPTSTRHAPRHSRTASPVYPTTAASASPCSRSRPLTGRRDTTDFPPGVLAVQWRDTAFDPPTTSTCRRGILAATVDAGDTSLTVVTCHLKSKLISYQRGAGASDASAFTPRDEGERLRYAGYAIAQRAAEAMTVRQVLDELLTGPGLDVGDGDGTGRDVQSWRAVTSTTNRMPRPRRSCRGRAARRSTWRPARASAPPTAATDGGCGTSRPCSPLPRSSCLPRTRRAHRPHLRLASPRRPGASATGRRGRSGDAAVDGRRPDAGGALRPRRDHRDVHRLTPGRPPPRCDPPDRHRGRMHYVLPMVEGAGR